MTASINGTTGVTFPDASVQGTAATGFGFKNRIINGAMMIDQRNAGASVTPSNAYILDRFFAGSSQASKYSVQQNAGSVTPPNGFKNYLGVTSLSAYSVGASDAFWVQQPIEGYNFADMSFGSASASTVTLSFWVRSSLTGTFGGALGNGDNTRSYVFSYTINSANTWEQKIVTITGDTTGTWVGATNGAGALVRFSIGMGSTYSTTAGSWVSGQYLAPTGSQSIVGTNGATFYITGVQLEKGSTATSFDYRPYGTELALCQRYYWKNTGALYTIHGAGVILNSTTADIFVKLPTSMRSSPTISVGGAVTVQTTTQYGVTGITNVGGTGADTAFVRCGTAGTMTAGSGAILTNNANATQYLDASSEL